MNPYVEVRSFHPLPHKLQQLRWFERPTYNRVIVGSSPTWSTIFFKGDLMNQIRIPNYPYVIVFQIPKNEIEKIDFALCEQPTETLEHYYSRQPKKPDLLFNGGFFDSLTAGNTIMTYVDDYETISREDWALYGFGVRGDCELVATNYSGEYRDFINGYPPLIHNGSAIASVLGSELNYNARRTVIGYNNQNVYSMFVDSPGLKYGAVQGILLDLGVREAINLDGGGSTRCLKNGEVVTSQLYSRPVDNVVAIYLKEKVIYRVQTGAFSTRTNAENYQKIIQNLPDTIGAGYKNAYIRLINGLYKVQVGAFSVKANAERVLEDLKNKGFNAFITTM